MLISVAKYRFTNAERFAVWKTFEGRCYWCEAELEFRQAQVDHVIAESLTDDAVRFAKLKTDYELPADFDVNDFRNWVPACPDCNGKKSATLYDPSPVFLRYLAEVSKRGLLTRRAHNRLVAGKKRDKILGVLAAALEMGAVTAEDVRELFRETEPAPPMRSDRNAAYVFTDAVRVIERTGNIEVVSTSRGVGVRSAAQVPHASWLCPTCGSNGPWNGVRCVSCGQISDPAD